MRVSSDSDWGTEKLKTVENQAVNKNKILVTVSGGVAYIMEDTVPPGYVAEIIDFDNINAGDDFPSSEAREYCIVHDLYQPPQSAHR